MASFSRGTVFALELHMRYAMYNQRLLWLIQHLKTGEYSVRSVLGDNRWVFFTTNLYDIHQPRLQGCCAKALSSCSHWTNLSDKNHRANASRLTQAVCNAFLMDVIVEAGVALLLPVPSTWRKTCDKRQKDVRKIRWRVQTFHATDARKKLKIPRQPWTQSSASAALKSFKDSCRARKKRERENIDSINENTTPSRKGTSVFAGTHWTIAVTKSMRIKCDVSRMKHSLSVLWIQSA